MGRVRNAKNKNPMRISKTDRNRLTFTGGGKAITRDVARLVGVYCLPLPIGLTEDPKSPYKVVHLNHDHLDDRATNLQWMSASAARKYHHTNPKTRNNVRRGREIFQYNSDGQLVDTYPSMAEAMRKMTSETGVKEDIKDGGTAYGFKWIINREDLPGEIWKDIPIKFTNGMTGYRASDLGRVKSPFDDRLIISRNENCYSQVDLNGCVTSIHNLISHVFHPESYKPGLVPNHKDGDKTNNSASNLEWSTQSQNIQHAYDTGLSHGSRQQQVFRVDYEKNIVGPYASYTAVEIETGIDRTCVRNSALKPEEFTKGAGGYQWTHTLEEAQAMIAKSNFDRDFFRVIQATADGKIVADFDTYPNAAKQAKVNHLGIYQSVKKGFLCGGFKWFNNKAAYQEFYDRITQDDADI